MKGWVVEWSLEEATKVSVLSCLFDEIDWFERVG